MAFGFAQFMVIVRQDNPTYERMYEKIKIRKSRLHNLVDWLRHTPHPTAEQVKTRMQQIQAAAWTKYGRTKAYLIREFALAGLEVPAGQLAVQNKQVVFHAGNAIHGYPPILGRPAQTGLGHRADGRFYWSVEVRYTLAPQMNPQDYAPFREERSKANYPVWGTHDMSPAQVRQAARAAPWAPDGPRYYNVKRGGHTICIQDNPGIDKRESLVLLEMANAYPVRFCAFFRMSLWRVKAGVNMVNDFNVADFRNHLGQKLPNSQVNFGCETWKERKGTAPRGNFLP